MRIKIYYSILKKMYRLISAISSANYITFTPQKNEFS